MRALILLTFALPAIAATNYDDDVQPIFTRYCFGCHSAAEMRSGLNLETYQGALKGSSGGDVVKPGRATSSILYQAVARDTDGVRPMPLGGARPMP